MGGRGRLDRLVRPPGEGNAGTFPVVRIDIAGAGCVLTPLLEEIVLGTCAGGVPKLRFTGIRGK
jgi:hypothetical protein